MNTFNLCLALGGKADVYGTHIIVCASEDPINPYEVTMVASNSLPAALSRNKNPSIAIKEVAQTVKQTCGCEAVVVSSDALLQAVPMKQPTSPSANPLESLIKAYDEAIAHYDFVIQDVSSDIYDPALQASKAPALAFLKAMRQAWQKYRNDAKAQLDSL